MSQYDPYSYGQVNLGGKAAPAAPPGPSADDLLFAAPEVAAKAAAADTSWDALDADLSSLLPNSTASMPATGQVEEFGADILGEELPGTAAPVRPRAGVRPAGVPEEGQGLASPRAARPPVAGQRAPAARAPGMAPPGAGLDGAHSGAKIKPPVRRPSPRRPGRAKRVLAALVPAAVLAGGGTGAAWLCTMEQNLVLGGICGALTLVAVAFSWIWLRG
jgi:hypothetical protein